MKGKPVQLDRIIYPTIVSPKLDGIRCLIVDGVPMSASLKPIRNKFIFEYLMKLNLPDFDGELIVGSPTASNVYRKTNSGVMSIKGEPDFTYNIFDMHKRMSMGSTDRVVLANDKLQDIQLTPKHDSSRLRLVLHHIVQNEPELLAYEIIQLQAGYEGIMCKHPSSNYKYGRCTTKEQGCMKLKRFEDGEAVIAGMTELMHNGNEADINELGYIQRSQEQGGKFGSGLMGALMVRDVKTNILFRIGSGFNMAMRQELWEAGDVNTGLIVKYKSFPVGVKDKPRHSSFMGFRDPDDMT